MVVEPSVLRRCMKDAMVDNLKKCTEKQMVDHMRWHIIQRGIDRPMLHNGNKFVMRTYVIPLMRPQPKYEDRQLEVWMSNPII